MQRQAARQLGPITDVVVPAADIFDRAALRSTRRERVHHALDRGVDIDSHMPRIGWYDVERIAHDVNRRRGYLRRNHIHPIEPHHFTVGLDEVVAWLRGGNQPKRLLTHPKPLLGRIRSERAAIGSVIEILPDIPGGELVQAVYVQRASRRLEVVCQERAQPRIPGFRVRGQPDDAL